MTSDELVRLLTAGGIEARVHGEEVRVRVCLACGNERWNLELNPSRGVYHCWVCHAGRGERLDRFLSRTLGGTYHIPTVARGEEKKPAIAHTPPPALRTMPIHAVPSAAQYLARRGVTLALAAQYELSVCVEPKHALEGRILFPARDFWTGDVRGWIGRSYTGKRPKYYSALPQKCITGWRTSQRTAPVVVVEGPLDGLVVHQAGFHAAVLGGTDDEQVREWAARLPPAMPVVILLDADALTQAYQLYWKVVPQRSAPVAVATLPAEADDPAKAGVELVTTIVREAIRSTNATH